MGTAVPAIEDYAVIGDGRSAALVSRDGSLDWLCWPRFDSPALFAALLDQERGGTFRVAIQDAASTVRRYLPDTNVLETQHRTPRGTATVLDLMVVASEEDKRRRLQPDHQLVRLVRCDDGDVVVDVRFAPRPRFGLAAPTLVDAGPLGVRLRMGAQLVTLQSDRSLATNGAAATGRVLLRAGERVAFSLTFNELGPAVLPPLGGYLDDAVARSIGWWRDWAGRLSYDGPYRALVRRSALAIKLLAFAPSGAIVAAPTTSLPERPGGDLNWDYRFCWLRDAAFTARALFDLGCERDGIAFCDWLLHATRLDQPRLRVLYDVVGNPPPEERILAHLAGYEGARPVRVGNAAATQRQLDVYGEVIDAAVQLARRGRRLDGETQRMLRGFGHEVCRRWREPDAGIWEERGAPRHRTHSRLLCWVALDRLLALHGRGLLRRLDADTVRRERDDIARDIRERAYDQGVGGYVSELGGREADASLLLLSWYGFEAPDSDRMRGTWRLIKDRLRVAPGLFHRYEKSRSEREGAFGICSFWAAEHLARGGGSLEEARETFEDATAHANDLGLFAEEIEPVTGRALGNFPQAYTHVGLINAALSIAEREARQVAPAPADATPAWRSEQPEAHP